MRVLNAISFWQRGRSKAFSRSRRGSTAVEFALVAFPFFLLIMSILELGLIALSSATVKNGVREAARESRVGSAQCLSRAEVTAAICNASSFAPSCESRLSIRQIVFPTGWQSNIDEQTTAFGGANDYQVAQGGDVVVVQARYDWSIVSPIVSPFLGDGEGKFPFRQSFAYQAEGFASQSCG